MSRTLTQLVQNMITARDVLSQRILKIAGIDYSAYLLEANVSADTQFGSMAATFTLNNDAGIFGDAGTYEINVGDVVQYSLKYYGDTIEWGKFYGKVEQRSIEKKSNSRTITLTCLDYISVLKQWDVDLEVEGIKVKVENEILKPNYLSSPNEAFSQLFDFANDSIADNPRPILLIRDKNHLTDDPQYDGFDVYYDVGQVKLGSPLNALYNYDLIARSYYYYTHGIWAEDVIESLLTQVDGYGKFLFGETSAANVIVNHLTTTLNTETGSNTDILTPNYTPSTIKLETTLSSPISAGDVSISVVNTAGFPTSGIGEINGDIFTWTGKTATTLTGIPATGANALKIHPSGSYVEYETTYAAGQVWYLSYNNISTDFVAGNFTIPGGTFSVSDKRFGRIILSSAISLTAVVTSNVNYTFKTLQATGIELNRISFKSREVDNLYEAINKLRDYLAPNYIIRTEGTSKIWSSYLTQKTIEDYTLELIQGLTYLEDEDLYTRVLMYGKNKNPTNIMFNEGISFETTGEEYKALASQTELSYISTENGWHKFKTTISDAGYITLETIEPIVYIDGIAVDNKVHQMIMQPIQSELTTKTDVTVQTDKKGNATTDTRSYYFYKIFFPHQSIEPSQTIYLYNANGVLTLTVAANDSYMDYARGIYYVPGDNQNSDIESLSTATYFVFYSTHSLEIDYDNVTFRIKDTILPDPSEAKVTATFEYWTSFTAANGTGNIIDGRWDSQVQTEFFAEPPSGYNYAIIDLGSIYKIQAIDIIAGFYKPDEYRKFDIDMKFSLHYSLDGIDYYEISDETHNIGLSGGESISLEEDKLGTAFQARYLKLVLENVEKIDYADGLWAVAFSELSAYDDIIIKSEAKLIATTTLSQAVTPDDTTIYVVSTANFTEPESGEKATAYIDGDNTKSFTYTGIGSGNTFVGCVISSGVTGDIWQNVSQSIESDTTIYDFDGLLEKLGDRVYKDVRISYETVYTQAELDDLAKNYLQEFYKNHTKISVDVLYAPHLQIGQTVSLTDGYNNISDVNYFIEGITDRDGFCSLILARYPA